MYFKKFLLLTAILTCFCLNLAKSNIQTLELQTKNGMQLVQIKENNNVYLPQESILMLGGNNNFEKRYTRNLSKIDKKGKRFVNISGNNNLDGTSDIEKICRDFLNANNNKLNINLNDLVLKRAEFTGNRWYVLFEQVYDGFSVKNAGVRFTIAKNGNIQTFKAVYFDDIVLQNTKPAISTLEAQKALSIGFDKPIETYSFEQLNNGKAVIVPYLLDGVYTYRLAYEYEITNINEFYTALVDINTGALLQRINNVNNSQIRGDVYGNNPNEPLQNEAIANVKVIVNGNIYTSDKKGNLDLPANSVGTAYSTKLDGKYAKMYTTKDLSKTGVVKEEYKYNGSVTDEGINMQGATENYDEVVRTLYYHTNKVHDYITSLDGSFNAYLTGFPCIVELLSGADRDKMSGVTFNAFSSGDKSISFYSANHNKVFVGRLPSVLYHEYGHSVNYVLYRDWGVNGRMISSTCNEATADITAAFMLDEPNIFKNVVAPGYENYLKSFNLIRTVDNNCKYPNFLIHESHNDGQILSGALWDLRKNIGLEEAEYFFHFARRETPDAYTVETAFANWFEALVKASDQGLGEFEYFDDILDAFNKHNIGFNLLAQTRFNHQQPNDNTTLSSTPITATIDEMYVPTQISEVYVNYYTNWDSEVKTILLNQDGNNFVGELPTPDKPTRYYYYFSMKNPYTEELINSREDYIVFVGYDKVYENNCETVANWVVEKENNTERGWANQVPKQIFISDPEAALRPAGDHTTGTGKCWTTGIEYVTNAYKTLHSTSTLVSPVIAINATYPVLSYYHYIFSSKSTSGSLKVELSYDGGATWTTAKEYSKISTFPKGWKWQRDYIHLDKYAGGNGYSNMKIRFVAFANSNNGFFTSLIDDIRIFNTSVEGGISVKDYNNNVIITPNPAIGDVSLNFDNLLVNPTIVIYDALGNIVYDIDMNGEFETCPLDVRRFGAGIYYLQVMSKDKVYNTTLNVIK
ncbi:MAG: T9SS type A sorting domain-containing protein [Bacteroidetes bacterium]|nr:T9SS type A sorting domain-containing protein [Bacteroidota bacterium]